MGSVVSANATIEFLSLEGGCWVLRAGDQTLEPVNLPESYRRDGLRVSVVYHVAAGVGTVCMVGQPVRIDTLRAR